MSRPTGVDLIYVERLRQVQVEVWTPEHDDAHVDGELARAARAYLSVDEAEPMIPPVGWPWETMAWKPGDPLRNHVKAGALVAAEIDRLLRAGAQ